MVLTFTPTLFDGVMFSVLFFLDDISGETVYPPTVVAFFLFLEQCVSRLQLPPLRGIDGQSS